MPKDPNQLAKSILKMSTEEEKLASERTKAAKILGSLGGAKGGPARAAKLPPERRREIAREGALKRWGKKDE
jgi:hypothetical protein